MILTFFSSELYTASCLISPCWINHAPFFFTVLYASKAKYLDLSLSRRHTMTNIFHRVLFLVPGFEFYGHSYDHYLSSVIPTPPMLSVAFCSLREPFYFKDCSFSVSEIHGDCSNKQQVIRQIPSKLCTENSALCTPEVEHWKKHTTIKKCQHAFKSVGN